MVEIAFENGRISNFQGIVTLTLNRVILHMTGASVDRYLHAKFNWNQSNFLWTYVRMYRWTFETHFIRLTQKSSPKTK